ncbi:hypothetical protein ACFGVS_19255 [Mucilaginibacter sp. AW1-7]|jgi:hypothetical protein|uniref:hypothetical protein n=1 Tax=Mucilaginibacter sp. AW1-7 TaxID=3349874 RepID=UPI003F73832F
MNFFPYENCYITSALSYEDAQLKLEEILSPGKGLFSPIPYFKGYIANGVFQISPDITYRNSFLPQIKGVIQANSKGCSINLTMRMYTAVEVFATLIAIGFGIAGLISVIYDSIDSNLKPVDFSLFLGALLVYILATAAFKAESIKAREKLLEIWDGELIKNK